MAENSEPTAATNSQSDASRTVWNVVSNWGGFTLSGLVNFALAPFVVRHLGNTYYGVTVLLLSLTGYLGLLDLGVRGATTRYIARFHSQSDHDSSSRFVSSALILFSLIGVLAILVCLGLGVFAGALPIPRGRNSNRTYRPEHCRFADQRRIQRHPDGFAAILAGKCRRIADHESSCNCHRPGTFGRGRIDRRRDDTVGQHDNSDIGDHVGYTQALPGTASAMEWFRPGACSPGLIVQRILIHAAGF